MLINCFKKCIVNMVLLVVVLQEFVEIHEGFYSDLLQANDSSSGSILQKTTSDCFITWKERFLIYGEFCSNLTSAQELIGTLCSRSPQIKTAVEVSTPI